MGRHEHDGAGDDCPFGTEAGAADRIAEGIRILRGTGAEATITLFQAYLADALRELGRTDEALALAPTDPAPLAAVYARLTKAWSCPSRPRPARCWG